MANLHFRTTINYRNKRDRTQHRKTHKFRNGHVPLLPQSNLKRNKSIERTRKKTSKLKSFEKHTSQFGTQTSRVRNKLHSVLQFLKLALARARADGLMSSAIACTMGYGRNNHNFQGRHTRSSYSSNVFATVIAPPPEISNDDAPLVTMSSPGSVTMGTPAQSTSPALVCALYLQISRQLSLKKKYNVIQVGSTHNGASIINRHEPSSSTCW